MNSPREGGEVSDLTDADRAEIVRLAYDRASFAAGKACGRREGIEDAARYRWLRDNCDETDIRAGLAWIADSVSPPSIDAAIDAAINKAAKS